MKRKSVKWITYYYKVIRCTINHGSDFYSVPFQSFFLVSLSKDTSLHFWNPGVSLKKLGQSLRYHLHLFLTSILQLKNVLLWYVQHFNSLSNVSMIILNLWQILHCSSVQIICFVCYNQCILIFLPELLLFLVLIWLLYFCFELLNITAKLVQKTYYVLFLLSSLLFLFKSDLFNSSLLNFHSFEVFL